MSLVIPSIPDVLHAEDMSIRRNALVGLIDSRAEQRAAIPYFLSKHGIVVVPFSGMGELPTALNNAVLLVADEENAVAQAVRRITFDSKIIAYTESLDLRRVVTAVRNGASNYLLWPEAGPHLAAAVRDCLAEIAYDKISGETGENPQDHIPSYAAGHQYRGAPRLRLSRREIQILKLVSGGSASNVIAESLGLSIKTVDCHRSNIIRKLGVANMTEAVRFGLRQGLIN